MSTSKVFLSYSQKHTELKDFFKLLIEDLGFEAVVFDYGSGLHVMDKQKELISNCDGLIGILTPDERTDSGAARYSMTVNHEISMAYKDGKYIQLFAINEVDFSDSQLALIGTICHLTGKIQDGEIVLNATNVRQLIRALLEVKSKLGELQESKRLDTTATIQRKSVEYTQTIHANGKITSETRIAAVALTNVDSLNFSAKLEWTKEGGNGIFLEKDALNFKLIKPEHTNIVTEIDRHQNHAHAHDFKVRFSPSIPTGTEMLYGYNRKYDNYYPDSLPMLRAIIDNGQMANKLMAQEFMVGQNMRVQEPTERLKMVFIFPPGIKITRYCAKAMHLNNDSEHNEESTRVNSLVKCQLDQFTEQITLVVEILKPQINCEYYLLYEPPK